MPQPHGRKKSRSYHSKSRGGCLNCKKRHIKCDQKRPACMNCTTRRLQCPFQDAVASDDITTTIIEPDSASLVPPITAVAGSNGAASSLQHAATDVSVIHLDLYHQFIFNVCPTFTGQPQHDDNYRDLITKTAFKHHFVLYEMLGLAALRSHVAVPSEIHKALATSFQEKAIAGLDDILTKVDSGNCVAIVLFAHLVGVHSFCDTFSSVPTTTFTEFLEALTGSAQLLRGINAVIRPFWDDLASTEVGEFMRDATSRRNRMASRCGGETASLHTLIRNADISESSRKTYQDSITCLQRDFDELQGLDSEQRATTNTAFAWLITSSPAYLQLMTEARPEALVILAYFAVILHHRRSCWAIGTAGHTLLQSIVSHLGRRWDQWLLWPQSVIGKDCPEASH